MDVHIAVTCDSFGIIVIFTGFDWLTPPQSQTGFGSYPEAHYA